MHFVSLFNYYYCFLDNNEQKTELITFPSYTQKTFPLLQQIPNEACNKDTVSQTTHKKTKIFPFISFVLFPVTLCTLFYNVTDV